MKNPIKMFTSGHVAAIVILMSAALAGCAPKQEEHQSFATPEAAVEGLVAALEKGDMAALGVLLGPGTGACSHPATR